MRKITLIIVHCSGTLSNRTYSKEQMRHDHVTVNGWNDIGYHYYIRRDGTVETCRPVVYSGAHAKGYNAHSIGICYEGGLDTQGRPADTRTEEQKMAMWHLVDKLCQQYPTIKQIVGHRDLPGVKKDCPCFDVKEDFLLSLAINPPK